MIPPPPRHKRVDQYQEMVDDQHPRRAQEERDKFFMDRLPHVQAASRQLHSRLEIFDDQMWPIPPLPEDCGDFNDMSIEINSHRIHWALDVCKDYAVNMSRESSKEQFLDETIMRRTCSKPVTRKESRRKVNTAATQDEEQLSKAKNRNFIFKDSPKFTKEKNKKKTTLKKDQIKQEDDSIMSELSRTNIDDVSSEESGSETRTKGGPLSSNGRQELELPSLQLSEAAFDSPDLRQAHMNADPDRGAPMPDEGEYRNDPAVKSEVEPSGGITILAHSPSGEITSLTQRQIDVSGSDNGDGGPFAQDSTDGFEDITWSAYRRSHALPATIPSEMSGPDPYNAGAADQGSRAEFAPNAEARRELAVTGVTAPLAGYDENGNSIEVSSDSSNEARGDEEDRSDAGHRNVETGTACSFGMLISSRGYVAAEDIGPQDESVPNTSANSKGKEGEHSPCLQESLEEIPTSEGPGYLSQTGPKFPFEGKTPTVPQPPNMPGTLTESLSNWYHISPIPILALTLDDVSTSIANPQLKPCVLLHHFEVGLDGVEAIIQGHVQIPETPERKKQRVERLQKLGMRKSGAGGFSGALRKAQEDKTYGNGLWIFFGVRFKQTSKEKKLRKAAKWLCFGIPKEACNEIKVPVGQNKVAVTLGGGVSRSGAKIDPYQSQLTRRHMLMCKGGIAPIDAWAGAENWKGGLLHKVRAAMANNGLRKRKQPGEELTGEEDNEALMKLARAQKPDVGTITARMVLEETAKRNAQRVEKIQRQGKQQDHMTFLHGSYVRRAPVPLSGGRPTRHFTTFTHEAMEDGYHRVLQAIPRTGEIPSRFFNVFILGGALQNVEKKTELNK